MTPVADSSVVFSILAKDQTADGLNSASGKMDKFKGAVGKASLGIVAGMAAAAPAMVGLSRRITELDAKSKTVFGKAEATVQQWAAANKTALGMTGRETVALATNMGDLLKPMGFTSAEAATQSTKMLDLAGALSSWSGGVQSAADVSGLLTDAMLGETDGLKALGIAISQDDVKARLAKQGKDKLTGAALQQAAALATQSLIMEKSTDAQDRWKNGARDAAESQNAMKVKMLEARESLAVALTPAITAVTDKLASMANWIGQNEGKVKMLATVAALLAGGIIALNIAMRIYAAGAAIAAFASGGWAGAFWALNAAMYANPVGLVVLAVAALAAGLIFAWKKSETFRRIVAAVFNGLVDVVVGAVKMWLNAVLGFAEGVLRTLDKVSLGLIPGLDSAIDAVVGFKNKANAQLEQIKTSIHIVATADASQAVNQLQMLKAAQEAATGKLIGPVIGGEKNRPTLAVGGFGRAAGVTTSTTTGGGGGSTGGGGSGGGAKEAVKKVVTDAQKALAAIKTQVRASDFVKAITGSVEEIRAAFDTLAANVKESGQKALLKLNKSIESTMVAMAKRREKLEEKIKDSRLSKIREDAAEYKKAFLAAANVTSLAEDGGSFATLMAKLIRQRDRGVAFAGALRQLRAQGLNETTLGQLREGGSEAGLTAAEQIIRGGGASGIGQINALMSQIGALGKGVGRSEAEVRLGLTEAQAVAEKAAMIREQKALIVTMNKIAKQTVQVNLNVTGADKELVKLIRKWTREAGGSLA